MVVFSWVHSLRSNAKLTVVPGSWTLLVQLMKLLEKCARKDLIDWVRASFTGSCQRYVQLIKRISILSWHIIYWYICTCVLHIYICIILPYSELFLVKPLFSLEHDQHVWVENVFSLPTRCLMDNKYTNAECCWPTSDTRWNKWRVSTHTHSADIYMYTCYCRENAHKTATVTDFSIFISFCCIHVQFSIAPLCSKSCLKTTPILVNS